jgi:hypothetical protein
VDVVPEQAHEQEAPHAARGEHGEQGDEPAQATVPEAHRGAHFGWGRSNAVAVVAGERRCHAVSRLRMKIIRVEAARAGSSRCRASPARIAVGELPT